MLKQVGSESVLRRSRWLLQKRPENLTEKPERKLAGRLHLSVWRVLADWLREDCRKLRDCRLPTPVRKFLSR